MNTLSNLVEVTVATGRTVHNEVGYPPEGNGPGETVTAALAKVGVTLRPKVQTHTVYRV